MSIDPDLLDDDLSGTKGTETLPAPDLVSGELPASSKRPETPYWGWDNIPGTIPVTERFDPMAWWSQPEIEEAFSALQRWAFDAFACPATSCKCGRVQRS